MTGRIALLERRGLRGTEGMRAEVLPLYTCEFSRDQGCTGGNAMCFQVGSIFRLLGTTADSQSWLGAYAELLRGGRQSVELAAGVEAHCLDRKSAEMPRGWGCCAGPEIPRLQGHTAAPGEPQYRCPSGDHKRTVSCQEGFERVILATVPENMANPLHLFRL